MEESKTLTKDALENDEEQEKVQSPAKIDGISDEKSSETKTEVIQIDSGDNEVEQSPKAQEKKDESVDNTVEAEGGEEPSENENSTSKEEIERIESIPSESDDADGEGEDDIEMNEDDEEEVADESAYEEELIEDTDPEDQYSEHAVVLSSDGDTSQSDEDEYDDNDLMDSVIMSSKKDKDRTGKYSDENTEQKKRKRSERDSTEERENESKPSDSRLDWRADLKKRLKSGSNAFNDSESRRPIESSQHSEDEEDFVLDIDVGAESTYDDDGYPDESDDQSSNPPSKAIKKPHTEDGYHDESDEHSPNHPSKATIKPHAESVIELDSSPEKSPKKQLSCGNPVKLPFLEESKSEPNSEEKTINIEASSSEKNKDDKQIDEAVDDNTLVPTEKEEVPNDKKDDILNKSIASDSISTEKDDQDQIKKPPSISVDDYSKLPNEVVSLQADNTKNDIKPTESMDFSNEDTAINSPKTDLKESTGNDEEQKSTRVNKRRRSSSCSIQDEDNTSNTNNTFKAENQEGQPAKKLKAELDAIFPKHNQVLTDYLNKTSNETVDNIQCHINKLYVEIQTLNDMIKTNENEWNNMIYLKKMKEEICIRLTRKKQTIQLESKKIGDISAYFNDLVSDETLQNDQIEKLRGPQLSSTPLHNKKSSDDDQHMREKVTKFLNEIENSKKYSEQNYLSHMNLNRPNTENSDGDPNLKEKVTKILNELENKSKSIPQSMILERANMKSSELAKEKLNMQKVHRNILPKPTPLSSLEDINLASSILNGSFSQHQGILNNYLTTSGLQHLGEMLNGHSSGSYHNGNNQPLMVGRQGVFKDVKSIIADYRQQHPESVPRRGRRVKQSSQNASAQYDLLKTDTNSRPSSNDSSSHSMSNAQNSQFTDFLVQLNKMTGQSDKNNQGKLTVTSQIGCSSGSNSGSYPEVTLHPVAGTTNDQAGSLLHGILTKNARSKESAGKMASAFSNNFSPTLAKLLTAPERMGSSGNNSMEYQNISKVVGNNSEITITPVLNSSGGQHTLLQQHLQPLQLKELMSKASSNDRIKTEHYLNMDEEADDSVDRLVIDEGNEGMMPHDEQHSAQSRVTSHAIDENDVPVCQGCKKNEAQFVCAGCGNQWYCSRDCQVTAWDDHSEVCTATKQIRKKYNLLKTRDVNFNNNNNNMQLISKNGRKHYLIIRRK